MSRVIFYLGSLGFVIGLYVGSYYALGRLTELSEFYEYKALLFDYQIGVQQDQPAVQTATWYDYDLPDVPGYSESHATAASNVYPKGTCLIVERPLNGHKVKVFVNDHGPAAENVDIDLSSYAFSQLASLRLGVIKVIINLCK